MRSPRRMYGSILAVTALLLTALGAAVAVIDSNPAGVNENSLALHGQLAHTARLALTIDTGQQYQVTGDVDVNFDTNELAGTLSIPTIFSTTNVGVVLSGGRLYLGAPSLASVIHTPWVYVPNVNFDLFRLEAALVAVTPDLPFLTQHLGAPTVTHNGPLTTYAYGQHTVTFKVPGSTSMHPSQLATFTLSVTAASADQLAGLQLRVRAKSWQVNIEINVLSYNSRVTISVPRAHDVQSLTTTLLDRLFGRSSSGSLTLKRLLSPGGIASLGQIHIN